MSDLIMVLLTNTLGESILVETLKSAAYFLMSSANKYVHYKNNLAPRRNNYYAINKFRDSRECYFFIQGTGLDDLIQAYSLDYDAETIRRGFNFYIRHSI